MKYRKLGTTDLDVSVICLGTMTWGEQNTFEEGYEQIMVNGGNVIPFITNVNLTPYYNSTEGKFSAVLKASSQNSNVTSEVTLNIHTNGTFGVVTQVGDSVSVHYAGIIAMNGQLFDSSMEEVWDNYSHRRLGVIDAYRHVDPLSASNPPAAIPS